MNALTRYVLLQLMMGMVFVTAGLTCVIWLSQSLRFVDMIVNRGLTAGMFIYLTMLLLPNFLSIILPIALFTVVVFTYSKLITDRELVVMRSVGLSQFALAKPALVIGFIVVLLGYALNLYLLPNSYRMFRELQWDIRYSYSHILLQEGAFNTVTEDITVYVRERSGDGELHGILVHDARKKGKPVTYMATRGAMVEADDAARVILFEGNRQEVDKEENKLSILYFDRTSLDLEDTRKKEAVRYREARERPLGELLDIEEDKLLNWKDYGKFRVEAHKRLVSPLYALGFTVVGLAFLISGSVSRRGQTRRIILAVFFVILLQAAALGLENVCARNLELIPLMYVNGILPIVLGFIFMMQSLRWRRSRPADEIAAGAA